MRILLTEVLCPSRVIKPSPVQMLVMLKQLTKNSSKLINRQLTIAKFKFSRLPLEDRKVPDEETKLRPVARSVSGILRLGAAKWMLMKVKRGRVSKTWR